jgi:hypothetical protein
MQHIEKVNINKEDNTVIFHSLTEEREYQILSYKAFLTTELSEFYPKSDQWEIEALIDTADAENLLTGYNEKFTEGWNDSRLLRFKGTAKIQSITVKPDTFFPKLRGRELVNDGKKVVSYVKHEIAFENGLEGRLISSKDLDLKSGQEIEFELTKTYGKYTRDYKKGGYYYPIYYSITLLQDVKKVKVRKQSLVAA